MTASETIAANATKLGHDAIVAAVAISISTGEQWDSLCFWCAEVTPDAESYRVHGGCQRCAYYGRDCFVVRREVTGS